MSLTLSLCELLKYKRRPLVYQQKRYSTMSLREEEGPIFPPKDPELTVDSLILC